MPASPTSPPIPLPPNVLITGTPGTGKTTTAELVVAKLLAEERDRVAEDRDNHTDHLYDDDYAHIQVGRLVKEHGFHEGKDHDFDSYILDEDKVSR